MSKYADEGAVAHALAAMCLTENTDAAAYIGRVIECEDGQHHPLSPSGAHRWMACPGSVVLEARGKFTPRSFSLPVTEDMARDVQTYLDNVRQYAAAPGAVLMVEQRLSCEHATGVAGHGGTGDAVVLLPGEVQVHDLKFGRGVLVEADENQQLMLYALGALELVESLGESVERVRLVIHQPRLSEKPSEWDCSVAWLADFGEKAREAAGLVQRAGNTKTRDEFEAAFLNPGEKQCRFCDAKATCPALARAVQEGIGADFSDLDAGGAPPPPASLDGETLAAKLRVVPMIEAWCSAVAAHAEAELLAGKPVPGFKLVQGRKGSRAWVSKDEAEAEMKRMRLKHDEMYDYSVISPTTAEKRLAKEHPRQWSKLSTLVTQAEGRPTVVPESDKRPALVVTPIADDFSEVK